MTYLKKTPKTSNHNFVHKYDSDQLGYPPFNMTKTIAFDSLHTQGLKTYSCGKQRLWTHLWRVKLIWVHWEWEYTPHCWFPYGAAPYFHECSPHCTYIRNRAMWIVEYVKSRLMISWHKAQTIIFNKYIPDFEYHHDLCTTRVS